MLSDKIKKIADDLSIDEFQPEGMLIADKIKQSWEEGLPELKDIHKTVPEDHIKISELVGEYLKRAIEIDFPNSIKNIEVKSWSETKRSYASAEINGDYIVYFKDNSKIEGNFKCDCVFHFQSYYAGSTSVYDAFTLKAVYITDLVKAASVRKSDITKALKEKGYKVNSVEKTLGADKAWLRPIANKTTEQTIQDVNEALKSIGINVKEQKSVFGDSYEWHGKGFEIETQGANNTFLFLAVWAGRPKGREWAMGVDI